MKTPPVENLRAPSALSWERCESSLEFLRWLDRYDRSRLAARRGFLIGSSFGGVLGLGLNVGLPGFPDPSPLVEIIAFCMGSFGVAGALSSFFYVRYLFPMSTLGGDRKPFGTSWSLDRKEDAAIAGDF